jgi:hypothetical protein
MGQNMGGYPRTRKVEPPKRSNAETLKRRPEKSPGLEAFFLSALERFSVTAFQRL